MWARSVALEQVFGDWAFNLVSVLAGEALEVGGVEFEVRALEAVVLLVMLDDVGDVLLVVEAALIDGVLGEVGLDDIELGEVAAAVAVAAERTRLVVVAEVQPCQPLRSSLEVVCLLLAG